MIYSIIVTALFLVSLVAAASLYIKLHFCKPSQAITNKSAIQVILDSKIDYIKDTMCLLDHVWVDSPLLKRMHTDDARFISAFSKHHHRYVYWLLQPESSFERCGYVKSNFDNLNRFAIRAYNRNLSELNKECSIDVDFSLLKNGDIREMSKLCRNILVKYSSLQFGMHGSMKPVQVSPQRIALKDNVVDISSSNAPKTRVQAQPIKPPMSNRLGNVRIVGEQEYAEHFQSEELNDIDLDLIPVEKEPDAAYLYYEMNNKG